MPLWRNLWLLVSGWRADRTNHSKSTLCLQRWKVWTNPLVLANFLVLNLKHLNGPNVFIMFKHLGYSFPFSSTTPHQDSSVDSFKFICKIKGLTLYKTQGTGPRRKEWIAGPRLSTHSGWINQSSNLGGVCIHCTLHLHLLKQFPPARILTSPSHSPSKHKTSEVRLTEQVCQYKKEYCFKIFICSQSAVQHKSR